MAETTFKENRENKRLYIAGAFTSNSTENKDIRAIISVANDLSEPEDVSLKPMLMYDTNNRTKNGEPTTSYTVMYSRDDWDKITDNANYDGDDVVINADVVPTIHHNDNRTSYGFKVVPDSVTKPDIPFDYDTHVTNTKNARNIKATKDKQLEQLREANTHEDDGPEM